VKFAAHLALQGGIDELVLAHARQAGEGRGHDPRAIVVAVARQIVDGDLGVGKGFGQVAAKRLRQDMGMGGRGLRNLR
jgi:hypothetical protein